MNQHNARSGCGLWIATLALASIAFLTLTAQPPQAQEAGAPHSLAESPYFFVESTDASLDRLPLKATQVDVTFHRTSK